MSAVLSCLGRLLLTLPLLVRRGGVPDGRYTPTTDPTLVERGTWGPWWSRTRLEKHGPA